jgi:small subunit ribosomal protein S19
MTRSAWKGPYVASSILKKVGAKRVKNFQIWSRNSVIPEFLIGQTVSIHNGKEFKNVTITREKVGFKFGEFSPTRRYNIKKKPSKKK